MRYRVAMTLVICSLGAALTGTAQARKPSFEDHEQLRGAAERELALTVTANALEHGRAALARERESLDWAGELLEQRGRQSLGKIDAYTKRRTEREAQARVRTRALYKLTRGGGMLELMLEDGADGRLTPAQRRSRGRSMRSLVNHDLELLRVHIDAQTRAADDFLTATRELSALQALESIARMQAEAIELTGAQLGVELEAAHAQRTAWEQQAWTGRDSEVRQLLRELTQARRDLARQRGLDLLEDNSLVRPVEGRVVAGHGEYHDRLLDMPMHRNGVELAAVASEKVRAIAAGEVVMVGALPGFEQVVVVDHGGGYLSLTGRLLSTWVEEGETVGAGRVLGRVGAKAVDDGLGTTVYLEVRHGQRVVDPARYLRR